MDKFVVYGRDPDQPSPIVALSIFDRSTLQAGSICDTSKILIAVRNPETNDTHPNVISVPTQRIPPLLFQDILKSSEVESILKETTYYRKIKISNLLHSGHHPVVYVVESILTGKLGVAEKLESGAFDFEATLSVSTIGKSCYSNLPPERLREEHILMANIMVVVSQGDTLFPDRTQAYSHLFWTEVSRFLETVQDRNPAILSGSLDPFAYCIRGTCISTTYNFVLRMLNT